MYPMDVMLGVPRQALGPHELRDVHLWLVWYTGFPINSDGLVPLILADKQSAVEPAIARSWPARECWGEAPDLRRVAKCEFAMTMNALWSDDAGAINRYAPVAWREKETV